MFYDEGLHYFVVLVFVQLALLVRSSLILSIRSLH